MPNLKSSLVQNFVAEPFESDLPEFAEDFPVPF
jgi:hypothetical protein